MGRLILVRHSLPQIVEDQPSINWSLGPEGHRRASLLAVALAPMKIASLFSSAEEKAIQTAEPIAKLTGVTAGIEPGFNEHERSKEPFTDTESFERVVTEALRRPDERVYGSETVSAAVARFDSALGRAAGSSRQGDMAIVTHGTVMSGFVASRVEIDVVVLWQSLGLPGLIVLNWPDPVRIELRRNFG